MTNKSAVIAAFSLCLLASCNTHISAPEPQPSATLQRKSSLKSIIDVDFKHVELTPETKRECANAIRKMNLICDAKNENPANTMDEALWLIWNNFYYQSIATPRSCIEYSDWFLISRLNTANPDDGSFKTGIAVKKGTTEIYKWK